MKSGDALTGTIRGTDGETLVLVHPDLGELRIPLASIASYGPVEQPSTQPQQESPANPGAAPQAPVPPTGPKPPPPPTSPSQPLVSPTTGLQAGSDDKPATATLPPQPAPFGPAADGEWRVHAAFALAGNFSVTNEFAMRAGLGGERETHETKTTLEGEYYYRVFESRTTDDNILLKGLQEWRLGESPWLFFVQGQYQYDEFQPWTHRFSAYVGPGYRVFETERVGLTLRAGAGATYEAGDVHEWEPEVLVAEDFRWRISGRQQLTINSSIAPNVEDLADYRVQSSMEYRLLLDEARRGLSLTAGLRDIYLSKPAEDGKTNELRIYGGLRYDF